MSKKISTASNISYHPPIGTLIDGNALQLVEILGVGGYGVVYRAIDAYSWQCPRSYAVKCLTSARGLSSIRRQLHLREITLHQIASAHPGVVTLHRVVEDHDYTFIIMDYAPDHDLFTQILQQSRYLGDDTLIKHVFLQLLDAVQYCHSLGIYHRDLKPENILCFDHGYRIAITDFGLATTEKSSEEYRTGSVYHMSPECQAAESEDISAYSPLHNDVWSLGIILLNLATGRNPWKSATPDDPTYQAYQRDPQQFLTSVLPISDELNEILIQALEIDWTERMSVDDLRDAIENIDSFYSDTVIFEGSLARCPWEAGIDLGNGTQHEPFVHKRPVPDIPDGVEPYSVVSMSATGSAYRSQASVMDEMLEETSLQDYPLYDHRQDAMGVYDDDERCTPYNTSARSSYSSDPSSPATPSSFHDGHNFAHVNLKVDTAYGRQRYHDMETTTFPSFWSPSTEDEDDNRFASSVFLATPAPENKLSFADPGTSYLDTRTMRNRYPSPTTSVYLTEERPPFSRWSSDSDSIGSVHSCQLSVDECTFGSSDFVDVEWPESHVVRGGSRPIDIQHGKGVAGKAKGQNLFNSMRFFPRSSGSSWLNPKTSSRHVIPDARQPVSSPPVPPKPWYDPSYPTKNTHSGARLTNRGR